MLLKLSQKVSKTTAQKDTKRYKIVTNNTRNHNLYLDQENKAATNSDNDDEVFI